MKMVIPGGAGFPATTDSSGAPAANTVAEVTSMPAGPYVVEQGPFVLQTVTGVATHTLGATGAAGDFLHSIIFSRAPKGTKAGLVYLREDGNIVMQFEFDPITEGIRAGMVIPINAFSQGGAWSITIVDANSIGAVSAVGNFT